MSKKGTVTVPFDLYRIFRIVLFGFKSFKILFGELDHPFYHLASDGSTFTAVLSSSQVAFVMVIIFLHELLMADFLGTLDLEPGQSLSGFRDQWSFPPSHIITSFLLHHIAFTDHCLSAASCSLVLPDCCMLF